MTGGLQAAAEAALGLAHALGDGPHLAVGLGDERNDAIGLSQPDRPQHHTLIAVQAHPVQYRPSDALTDGPCRAPACGRPLMRRRRPYGCPRIRTSVEPEGSARTAEHDLARRSEARAKTQRFVPPKRRCLPWNSRTASNRCSRVKSGQSVSVKTSSLYASSHRRKLEIRYSPDVRMTRSGSGISGSYRCDLIARSSIFLAGTLSATRVRTASTISARPP